MSRILKNKKTYVFGCALLLDIVAFLLIKQWWYWLVIANIFILCILLLNREVKKELLNQKASFGYKSRIRNVDCLIIGDICSPKSVLPNDCLSYVQIKAPDRSLQSSFEILKHTSSILKEEDGTVILVCKKENIDKVKFTVLDEFFFVGITLKKYGIEALKKYERIPLLINPIQSLRLLFYHGESDYKVSICPSNEIIDFCRERDMKLIFMIK